MYRLKLDPKTRISYTYFLISTAWIVVTDILFAKGDFRQAVYQSCKGLLFAAITAYLLYLLIDKHYGAKQKIQRERNEAIETYTQLFEQHGLPQLLIDPLHGKIVQANDAAATFYGWSQETLCSMSISEINLLSEDEVFYEMAAADRNVAIILNLFIVGLTVRLVMLRFTHIRCNYTGKNCFIPLLLMYLRKSKLKLRFYGIINCSNRWLHLSEP